ncbi:MAG: twitch domain-containing radical SAM protein, partial [Bdellovibrionota bacterium]
AWNSPLMGSVRRQMLMGEKPSACKSCFNLEDQGVPSPRQTFALRWQELAQEQALTVNRAGEIQESPKVFDFQIGNICNLKCRMCNPTYSAGLAEEHGKIYGRDFSEERKNVWLNNSALLKALAAASSGVKELNVIGGEPMVSKEFLSLLKGLVESGESRNIFLCFNTNLTLLPPELIDLFPKFRGVRIAISLDGHGNVNDFIRFPSKFSIIEKNIHFLAENRERLAIQEISFNTTVQVYNLFGLPDLFAYLQRSFPRLAWFPVLSLLTHPVPLSVLVFPQESRRKAVVRLRKYLEELENSEWTEQSPVSRQEIQLRVESLIQYLSGEDKSALIPEFLRIHNIYDEHRGQKISFDLPGIVEHALG